MERACVEKEEGEKEAAVEEEWMERDRNSGGSTHEAQSGLAGKARSPLFEVGWLLAGGCVEEHVSY